MKDNELEAFRKVQEARNPRRPYTSDLIDGLFEDFREIHGDRRFADDPAIICGFARFGGDEILVIGHQKGRDMSQRRYRNFGMPKPEGYRKALRAMKLAEKFGRPVITIIDTPGAYPGIDAEERGQAEAIAFNLREMALLKVPIVVLILGEGGSGGALALGVGDRILMMENSVYSVITPEGCAAILWKDAAQAPKAAEGLRLTANNLVGLGVIDGIVAEKGDFRWEIVSDLEMKNSESLTLGGYDELEKVLRINLEELKVLAPDKLVNARFAKFRLMGKWLEK